MSPNSLFPNALAIHWNSALVLWHVVVSHFGIATAVVYGDLCPVHLGRSSVVCNVIVRLFTVVSPIVTSCMPIRSRWTVKVSSSFRVLLGLRFLVD